MKLFALFLVVLSVTPFAIAESGHCVGSAKTGEAVSISYFTNGYSDNAVDYYAKIRIGSKPVSTYALFVSAEGLNGTATTKSIRLGLNLGVAELYLAPDKTTLSGTVGKVELGLLKCSPERGDS